MEDSEGEELIMQQQESHEAKFLLLKHSIESKQALENIKTLEEIIEKNNQYENVLRQVEERQKKEQADAITEAIPGESFEKLCNEHVQVYRVVGKGVSTFALHDIQCGERIICEKPLFSVDGILLECANKAQARDIAHTFYALDKEKQQDCLELCGPKRSERCQHIVKIFNINAYSQDQVSYLCRSIARINNSCMPNAWVSWDAQLEKACVHAIQSIRMGEEVTISYFQNFDILDYDSRKDYFRLRYNFTCDCKACDVGTHSGRKSFERRTHIQDLRSRIRVLYTRFDNMNRTMFDEEIGALMGKMHDELLEECLFGREYVAFLEAATLIRLKMESVDLAKGWAIKCLHAATNCYGQKSPLVAKIWSASLRLVFSEKETNELGYHVKATSKEPVQ